MTCTHDRAYPAIDSPTGWRCPDCQHRPAPDPSATPSLTHVYGNSERRSQLPPFIAPPRESRQRLEKLQPGDLIGILVEARGIALWTFGTIVSVNLNHDYPFKVRSDWGEGERVLDFPWCSVREFPYYANEPHTPSLTPDTPSLTPDTPSLTQVYGNVSENQPSTPSPPNSSVNVTTKPKSFRKRETKKQLPLFGRSSFPDLPIAQEIYPVPSHGRHYWRYVARYGRTVLYSLHIPGGACGNSQADKNAEQIRKLIKQGKEPNQVVAAIAKYKNCPT